MVYVTYGNFNKLFKMDFLLFVQTLLDSIDAGFEAPQDRLTVTAKSETNL
jgi:hypothetical protein